MQYVFKWGKKMDSVKKHLINIAWNSYIKAEKRDYKS